MRPLNRRRSSLAAVASRSLLVAIMLLTLISTAAPAPAKVLVANDRAEKQLTSLRSEFLAHVEEPSDVSRHCFPRLLNPAPVAEQAAHEMDCPVALTHLGGRSDGELTSASVLDADDASSYGVDSATVRAVYLPLVIQRWPPIPDTPVLDPINNPAGGGNYTVSWRSAHLADTYILQEDQSPAFSSPSTAYSGSGTSTSITSKAPGTYNYRVRAINAWGQSGWSNVQQVTVSPPQAEVYIKNDTGGTLCYEVRNTSIGQKCFSSGTHLYGTFPTGTYSWHASARCGSASGTRYFAAGGFTHQFWCE